MTKIEKHFRLMQLGERIRQLQSELAVIVTEGSSAGMYPLHVAEIHLGHAAKRLESTSTLDLETLLKLSIASVKSQTNEKTHASNVSLFSNHQPVLNQSGE